MCLLAWNWQPAQRSLLLAGNRDEFYARPTLPLHRWPGGKLIAGQDLQGGGTWLGLGADGRLAALTNYRSAQVARADAPTRGALVLGFLQGQQEAMDYLQDLLPQCAAYTPFNLLLYDGQRLLGLESRHGRIVVLQAGIGGVSNADFASPWNKLQRLQRGLADSTDTEVLLALLRDPQRDADAQLPHTGVPLELERALSAIFVATPRYGTRASSVVRLTPQGGHFTEVRFGAQGRQGRSELAFGTAP